MLNSDNAEPAAPRRIIVTGADSTARTIAEKFSDSGHIVSVCDVRPDAVSDLTASRPDIFGHTADMGREDDVNAFLFLALEKMGGVDFLVNVVGVAGPTKPTEEVTLAEWTQTLSINATGMFLTARYVIPYLKEQRFGGIVNFSTASTRTLLPDRSPYVASKYAVEGLTKNLARELGPYNIRANAILPGSINNARLKSVLEKVAETKGVSFEDAMKNAIRFVSMRTNIETEEIADMVHFLCSDAARHVSGQLIGVDGNLEWEE